MPPGARRRLKSPRSLSGTSTHPTMVTQRSWSWNNLHPFCSMSISPPIPEIRLFQTLTLKLQGHTIMGMVKGQDHTVRPVSTWFAFFSVHINQITIPEIQLLWNWPWKIQGQGHSWGQRSRSHSSPSIQMMHPLFVSHQSDQSFPRYVQ